MAEEDRNQQSISDDQELAKVLAGVTGENDAPPQEYVTTPMPVAVQANDPQVVHQPIEEPEMVEPLEQPIEEPEVQPAEPSYPVTSDLDGIKIEAINELRPLVDKLDVPPEERFDTYLLLLRSTDDRELIAPAHEAAKNIQDEARRAQALLDIIKEIDFLNQSKVL